jgi:hypothetical protein
MATARWNDFKIRNREAFFRDFPNLDSRNHKPTSPATPIESNPKRPRHIHNCFALVVGDETKWWWPGGHGYWPRQPSQDTVYELTRVLISDRGFKECMPGQSNGTLEPGIRKVAIFADDNNVPQHVCYQPDHTSSQRRTWKSKMGFNIDMEHTLHAISGKLYGHPVKFLYRVFEAS